jgi:hypothetical protein
LTEVYIGLGLSGKGRVKKRIIKNKGNGSSMVSIGSKL